MMLSDVNRSLLQCPLRLAHHRKAGSASLLRFCIRPSITITRQVQSKCGAAHLAAPPALHPLQPSRQSNHRNTKQRDDTTPCDHAACSIAVFVACAAVPPFAPPPRCAVSHPPCRVFCTSTVPRPVRRRRAVLLHLRGACVRTVGSRHCGGAALATSRLWLLLAPPPHRSAVAAVSAAFVVATPRRLRQPPPRPAASHLQIR